LSRLERAQDALRELMEDLRGVQAMVSVDGSTDPQLGTVEDQLFVARHKLELYVQRFRRERAAELGAGAPRTR
jgi:hypothetical protein